MQEPNTTRDVHGISRNWFLEHRVDVLTHTPPDFTTSRTRKINIDGEHNGRWQGCVKQSLDAP